MRKAFSSLFLLSLLAYATFAALEEFIPGFVADYFNVHLLLIPVIVFLVGLLIVENGTPSGLAPQKTRGSWLLIFLAGLATVVVLWIGANELAAGWRILVAAYGAILVVGILSVLFKE